MASGEILKVTGKRLGVPVEAFRIRRRDSILRPTAGEAYKVAKLLAGIEEDLSQKLREAVGVKLE